MALQKIEVLTTGGTIAGSGDSPTGSAYSAGRVSGEDLLASVPGLGAAAEITVRQISSIPSQDMNETVWLQLLQAIREDFERFDGFVITHGTDTMEETAFFLDLTIPAGKPVVLTGAMLPGTAVSADGPRNIFNAVCAAASPQSALCGVLACMNGELFSARGLFKSHTVALDTFASRLGGAIGWVQNGEAHFTHVPVRAEDPSFIGEDCARASALPKIAIIPAWAGVDGTAVGAYLDNGYQGLVIEGLGDGNIPCGMSGAVAAAVDAGVAVVRASRCPFGPVLANGETDDKSLGLICGGSLSAAQCRILLQLALLRNPGADREELQAVFSKF